MKHRLAFIGYGGMAGWHHENIVNKLPDIEVVGAFDIREEQRQKAIERGIRAYASQDELLRDATIDMVTIATPNDSHKQIAIDALKAGKHVILEKPATLNASELQQVMAVARATGRLFSVHQNRRWDKDFVIVKTAIDKGLVGRPYFVESRVLGSRGQSLHGWRAHQPNGGGMVLDWGVHLIDQAMQLFKEPVVSVDAHLFGIYSDEVDDNIKIWLRFLSGASVMLQMTTNTYIPLPRWHVTGTDATLLIQDWSGKGKIVRKKPDTDMLWEEDIVYTEAGPTRTMAPRPQETTEVGRLPRVTTDWTDYYKNVLDALDNGKPLIVKPEESLRVMQVIDTVFESHREGRGIKCHI